MHRAIFIEYMLLGTHDKCFARKWPKIDIPVGNEKVRGKRDFRIFIQPQFEYHCDSLRFLRVHLADVGTLKPQRYFTYR